MAGNVWEYTGDWYNIRYYKEMSKQGIVRIPEGED